MPQTLLPADICVEALVVAGGNTHLAAENLFGNVPEAVANLTASIAQDPLAQERLKASLRTLTMLRAYDTLSQAQNLIRAVLPDLEPAQFVKFYSDMLRHVSELTVAQQTDVDPADAITRLIQVLPPDARRHFLTLVTPPAPVDHALDVPYRPTPPSGHDVAGSTTSGNAGLDEEDNASATEPEVEAA